MGYKQRCIKERGGCKNFSCFMLLSFSFLRIIYFCIVNIKLTHICDKFLRIKTLTKNILNSISKVKLLECNSLSFTFQNLSKCELIFFFLRTYIYVFNHFSAPFWLKNIKNCFSEGVFSPFILLFHDI